MSEYNPLQLLPALPPGHGRIAWIDLSEIESHMYDLELQRIAMRERYSGARYDETPEERDRRMKAEWRPRP